MSREWPNTFYVGLGMLLGAAILDLGWTTADGMGDVGVTVLVLALVYDPILKDAGVHDAIADEYRRLKTSVRGGER